MTGLLIIILLALGLPYLFRLLRPLLLRWLQRRAERYMRQAMGMPPGGDDRRQRSSRQSDAGSYTRRRRHSSRRGPVIPKEYAEDVEFTEIRSYSEEREIGGSGKVSFVTESQVSDAEIIEIEKD